jgi:hypothetical protein
MRKPDSGRWNKGEGNLTLSASQTSLSFARLILSHKNARLAFDIKDKREEQAMERIEFWRKQLQGARLYDGRAKNNFSRICAALQANSGTSFSAACAGSLRQNGGRLFAHEKTTGEGLQHRLCAALARGAIS